MIASSLVGAIAMVVAPAFVFPPEPPKAADPTPDIAEMKDTLRDIKTGVLGVRNEMAGMKERVNGVDKRLDEIIIAAVTQNDALKRQLDQLKLDVDALRAQVNNRPTTAGSSPLGANLPPGPATPGANATFRITNTNVFESMVIVNGASYLVGPNSHLDVPIVAGTVTYSVPNSRMVGSASRTVGAGQAFGITIHP